MGCKLANRLVTYIESHEAAGGFRLNGRKWALGDTSGDGTQWTIYPTSGFSGQCLWFTTNEALS